MGVVLFLLFFLLLLLGIPIAVAIVVPSFLVIWAADLGTAMIAPNFFAGIAKFPFLAIHWTSCCRADPSPAFPKASQLFLRREPNRIQSKTETNFRFQPIAVEIIWFMMRSAADQPSGYFLFAWLSALLNGNFLQEGCHAPLLQLPVRLHGTIVQNQ